MRKSELYRRDGQSIRYNNFLWHVFYFNKLTINLIFYNVKKVQQFESIHPREMHQLLVTITDISPAYCTGGRDTRTQKSLLDTHTSMNTTIIISTSNPSEVLTKLERTQTTWTQTKTRTEHTTHTHWSQKIY